jgi:hypothetical protein
MDMKDAGYIAGLKQNMHSVFDTPQGKEVMEFLEASCGWYESVFDPDNRDRVLINAGRREVVATIKTFLKHTPEHILALAQQKE